MSSSKSSICSFNVDTTNSNSCFSSISFDNIPTDKLDQKVDEWINKFKQDTSYKKLVKIENDIEEIIFER